MSTSTSTSTKITREDLESKFRELQGDVEESATEAKNYAVAVAAVVVVGIAVVAFVLGRRKGRRKTTIVEIRRI
jgi:hypothetical protein